jgi:hypothetical protein
VISLDRSVVFDLEVFPAGRWCAGFLGVGANGQLVTHQVETPAALLATIDNINSRGKTIVGYNSARFDLPVLDAILRGDDPFVVSQQIIERGEWIKTKPPCDHIDLAQRLAKNGVFPSLKLVGAYLAMPRVVELPVEPGKAVSDEQWQAIRQYNLVDLEVTWRLLQLLLPELQALEEITRMYGVRDLRSRPAAQVTELIFRSQFVVHTGHGLTAPIVPQSVRYVPVRGARRPQNVAAAEWYDKLLADPIAITQANGKVEIGDESNKIEFELCGLPVKVGLGGLHSQDKPAFHVATSQRRLLSLDVSSCYPGLIDRNDIVPSAYRELGVDFYRSLLSQRLDIKSKVKTCPDVAEQARFKIQADGLKLCLNSFFGQTGNQHSSLFDPAAFVRVTLSAQLLLIDLIERLGDVNVRTLSVNTDGLIAELDVDNTTWEQTLAAWESDTGLSLERLDLVRVAILASNQMCWLDAQGGVKRTGAKLRGEFDGKHSPNWLVCGDAVTQALLFDVSPETTIFKCSDMAKFCSVSTVSKAAQQVLIDTATGEETILGRVVRFYRTTNSTKRLIHRFSDKEITVENADTGVGLALDLTARLPDDLDYGWYIGAARKIVQRIEDYPHTDRRLLGNNVTANWLFDLGLMPCSGNAKRVFAGADPKFPSLL